MRGAPQKLQDKGRDFLEYALWYGPRLGFRIFPIAPGKKAPPLIDDWPNKATWDEAQIREWWRKWPKANIGIATGRCRDGYFIVLDFDPRHGGNWYNDVGPDILPPTWVVHTPSGGRHFYYRTDRPLPGRKLPDGVDLKGEGGYVVAPPSIIFDDKGNLVGDYGWEVGGGPSDLPMATLPGWTEADQDGRKYYTMEPPIAEGHRYHFTASLMGLLLAKGADIEKVTDFILANQNWLFERGQKPFTEREIKAVGRWLSKKAPGRPVERWRPVLEKAGVAKSVIEAWAAYIGEPETPPEPMQVKRGGKVKQLVAELLEAAEWVKFRGDLWLTHKGQLYALSEANQYVYAVSGEIVSQQTAKEVAMAIGRVKAPMAKPIDGEVVLYDEAPVGGRAAGYEGVWLAAVDEIWVVTRTGVYRWPLADPPAGVYYRADRVLPRKPVMGPEGVNELRIYWGRATMNLDEGEKGPELSLAALAPVLLGLCRLGVFFTGEKGSGKSTAARAFLHMAYGREPISGMGDTNRDRIAVAAADRIFYADDIDITDAEMQKLMRVGLTGGKVRVRKLYETGQNEVMGIDGSYFLCGIEAKGLRADTLERFISLQFRPKVRVPEAKVAAYFADNWHKALGGLLTLYQRVASLPEPSLSAFGWVRMQDWLSWGVRFAEVLRVKEDFLRWVIKVRGAAMMQAKYGELAEAIVSGRIKEGEAYNAQTLAAAIWPDLATGGKNEAQNALYRKARAISHPSGRKALADIAKACGLSLRMQKVAGADGSTYWEYVFERPAFEQGWDVAESTLAALCDGVFGHPVGVGGAQTDPQRPNGHVPMGEGGASQIAPPASEPEPMAAQSAIEAPTPSAPETPMVIAVQSAPTPDSSFPTPEENERALAELRELLARMPKPGGILAQRSAPIREWVCALAPPELNEYLRASAFLCATEASRTSVIPEAQSRWWWAGKYLWDLTVFEPTREAIAGMFLAYAAFHSLEAATDPNMREAAVWLAGAAYNVFFGDRPPEVLLEILLATQPPLEYDPCKVPCYRWAVCYMIAAHWVLTGKSLKPLTDWVFGRRCDPQDAEEMLLFSLGRQKMWQAVAHLNLGDLPF